MEGESGQSYGYTSERPSWPGDQCGQEATLALEPKEASASMGNGVQEVGPVSP